MRNLLLLLVTLIISSTGLIAQSVPQGMRYQAIARSLDGNILPRTSLNVQVELFSAGAKETIFYTESHEVHSTELGILDFVIGSGETLKGNFSEIPWSTQEMWVRISVKTPSDDNFQIISSGQLFSVPYALYATTAGSLEGMSIDTTQGRSGGITSATTGVKSIFWIVEGNYQATTKIGGPPVVGTTDKIDLTVITRNTPRFIINKDGQVNFLVDVDIDKSINVDGASIINNTLDVTNGELTQLTGTLTVDKPTTLNDVVTVWNAAPTHLTGLLDVEGALKVQGAATFANQLEVTGNTTLSGTLRVDGTTTLNSQLTVQNFAGTSFTGSLDVDKTLNVDGATTLNKSLTVVGGGASGLTGTLVVDKATTLNQLTVANMSSTVLTGTLDVDKTANVDGAVTLNKSLDVTSMAATTLNKTLSVEDPTLLNQLTVANMQPTHLTGSLVVDGSIDVGTVTLSGPLDVTGMNPTTLSGTLVVDKLAQLESGISVSGGSEVGPGSEAVAFFDNTDGGSSDGIAIKIDDPELNKENNFMTFYRGTNTIAGRIEGYQFEDIADIPLPSGDEIWAAVCLAISDYNPVTIAWTQMASAFNFVSYGWNNTTIPAFDIPDIPAFTIPNVPALTIPDVPAFVISDVPGFVIPDVPGVVIPDIPQLVVGPYLCGTVCFCDCCFGCLDFNCCCVTECIIPQVTLFPGITIPDFPGIAIPDFPGIAIPDFSGFPVADFPGITIPDFPGLVIPAVPELNLANLFGSAPTIPTFNDILVSEGICPEVDLFDIEDGYLRRLADWAFEHRVHNLVTLDPVKLLGAGLAWGLESAILNDGVVFGSKGADYAEYLPKVYETERFMKGEVVGVYNGKISRNTKNADQVLAITSQPMVLGNMPDEADEDKFEKVAFLGQIPVFVKGPVSLGDYIIPSGKNDGIAQAISEDEMTADMLSSVLGKAWSDYDGAGVSMINTSIGLRPMEIAVVLKKQGETEDRMNNQLHLQRASSNVMGNDIELMKQKMGMPSKINNP